MVVHGWIVYGEVGGRIIGKEVSKGDTFSFRFHSETVVWIEIGDSLDKRLGLDDIFRRGEDCN